MPQFEAVFREHSPFVRRALARMGASDADLPDLLQEVFLVVLRRLDGFEGRSSLRTWLYGICLRVAAAQRRRVQRRSALFSLRDADVATSATQDVALSAREHACLLEACLARLSTDQRRVFIGFELEERPMAELAAELDCPLKTAFSRLHSARRRVNASLSRSTGAAIAWALPDAMLGAPGGGAGIQPPLFGKLGAWLASGAMVASMWGVLVAPPAPGMGLVATDPPREQSLLVRHVVVASAQPARTVTEAAPQTPRPRAAPAAQAVAEPLPPLEVVPQDLPQLTLHFERIALSEVVPVYRVRSTH